LKVVGVYTARSGAGFGGTGFCTTVVQPANSRINSGISRAMWIVYLEMFFALAVAIVIVWFTWPRKPK
jgi:hypothetical protein